MTIEKAKEAAELLRQKEELEIFFSKLREDLEIKKVVVHFDLVSKDGTVYPCFAGLDAGFIFPCLKEQLKGINRAIKNL